MPKLKFIRCVKSKINTIPVVDGQLIFTTDSYGIYLDLGSERKELSQIISLTSAERQEVLTPVTSFYFETDTGHLFYYDGKWTDISVDPNSLVITFNESEDLLEISSGETLSSAFGKIKTAINRLINHLKDVGNPHKVTKNQIGLSDVENKSSSTIRDELTKDNVINALGFTPPPKKIYDKAIIIGDSTTQGWDNDDYSYADMLAESGDFGEVIKLAQGGACLGPYETTAAGKGKSCIELIQSNLGEFSNADIVILQYCLNDINALMQSKVQLGSHDDTSESVSMVGYTKKILETLYSQNAHIKIYFLNLISDSDVFGALQSEKQAEYTYWHRYWMNIMRLIHEYGVQIINIMDDANFNYITNPAYTITTGDGTHLNTVGYRNVYHKIRASIDTGTQRLFTPQQKELIIHVSGEENDITLPEKSYELIMQANELGKRVYVYHETSRIYIQLSEFGENIFGTQITFAMDKPAILRIKITPKSRAEVTLMYITGTQ